MDAWMPLLRDLALVILVIWVVAEASGRGRRALPLVALALFGALLAWRGWHIAFLPLTNKYESFVGFAATLTLVGAWRYDVLARPGRVFLALAACGFLSATLAFDAAINYPSPLLVTAWYLAHVPLSFGAYALWLAGAADALDYLGHRDGELLRVRQEANVRLGLVLFSLAMVFGSVWGVVSWGAYFLWDPKILWSVASWVYFAALAHLRYWPVLRPSVRVVAGLAGIVILLITYVGTSFMTGSIHAF